MSDYPVGSILEQEFSRVWKNLSPQQQRKGMKSAVRREATKVRNIARGYLSSSGIDVSTGLKNNIFARVFPSGSGFMVSVNPNAHGGCKAIHKNRKGREKPVLFWAESGTTYRFRGSKRLGRHTGGRTGRMPSYHFMKDAEAESDVFVERDLWNEIEKNINKIK